MRSVQEIVRKMLSDIHGRIEALTVDETAG